LGRQRRMRGERPREGSQRLAGGLDDEGPPVLGGGLLGVRGGLLAGAWRVGQVENLPYDAAAASRVTRQAPTPRGVAEISRGSRFCEPPGFGPPDTLGTPEGFYNMRLGGGGAG